jgi:hypothetical protein
MGCARIGSGLGSEPPERQGCQSQANGCVEPVGLRPDGRTGGSGDFFELAGAIGDGHL